MKRTYWICLALLLALLLPGAPSLAEDAGMPLSAPEFAYGTITFAVHEDLYLYRVWAFTESGSQQSATRITVKEGTLYTQDGRSFGPSSSLLFPNVFKLAAGTVVECSDSSLFNTKLSTIRFELGETGETKLVYDMQANAWAPSEPFHVFGFWDGSVALRANRELYLYGVTVVTADGRQHEARSITNVQGQMFTRSGATLLTDSLMQLPGEIGLRKGTNAKCAVDGVEEADIAQIIFLLDKSGKDTAAYDYQAEAWLQAK